MEDNVKNLGKVCITPEGVWDVNKEYDRLSLVVTKDSDTQRILSYISRKHVPKGNISINNTEYWQVFTTELKLEDITIDENGNVKIGDVVIYQIPLGDALGEIVVDKIKADLTNHIMTEIRSYMNGMVTELINSFSNQIGRLIDNGFEIRNKLSGEVNAKHSGTIDVNVNGGGESEDHEFIFTGDDLNINVASSGGYELTHIVSTKDGDLIGFSGGNRPSWIDLLEWSIAGTQYRVQIRCKANTSETTRTGTITLTQNESGNTLTITVTQSGSGSTPSDTFVFESNRTDVTNTAIAGNNAISLTSTKNGNLIGFTTTNKPEWITVTSHENGTRHEVTLAFAANDSENDRIGTVVLTQNESGETVTINVTQYGTEHVVTPTHMVDVTVINGNTQEQIPNAHIEINNINARNITVDEGTDVFVKVTADGYIARDIVERPITQQDPLVQPDYEYSQTINDISQDAYITVKLYPYDSTTYAFTAQDTQLNANADTTYVHTAVISTKNNGFIKYKASIEYAAGSGSDWLSVRIPNSNNEHFNVDLTPNTSVQARTAVITLTQYANHDIQTDIYSGESGNTLTITVVQAGTGSGGGTDDGFAFTCNRAAINFGHTAATSEVAITSTKNGSNIEYTAQSSADWVSFSKSRAGVGTITVTENTSQSDRGPAVITLTQNESGKTLTINITQSGANSGGGDDSDVYVFEATPNTLSFDAGLDLTKTVNVVSTKNGNNIEFTLNGFSNWLTASINNGVVTITAEPNPSNETRTGYVRFLQVNGSSTVLTVNITQAGYEALPSGYEFAHMLDNNGENMTEISFNSTDPITFNNSTNFRTLTTILKENGTISDDTPTIIYNGYPANAEDVSTFTVNKSSNTLVFQVPTKPSTGVSTPYEFVVLYGNYGAKRTITLAYIPS